jgi:inhibitor of KinA sporulation pathway (predicted exonuclease)
MNIISIDLEQNQPSGKIIQLGYVIANVKSKEIKTAKSIIVNPNETLGMCIEGMSITDLTGLTQQDVDSGKTLDEAYEQMCSDISRYHVSKHPFQWGQDHFDLRNQLEFTWEEYIFRKRGHDIKSFYQLYQMTTANGKVISGLKSSMNALGMSWNTRYGNPHNALADAYNTLLTYWNIADRLKKYDLIERQLNEYSQKKI